MKDYPKAPSAITRTFTATELEMKLVKSLGVWLDEFEAQFDLARSEKRMHDISFEMMEQYLEDAKILKAVNGRGFYALSVQEEMDLRMINK